MRIPPSNGGTESFVILTGPRLIGGAKTSICSSGRNSLPPPLLKKATLHKIFMLDAQGGYRGFIPLDEMCLVEYEDFVEALPERGLGDGESIFLNEWKATAIYGEKMGIIAISKGSLGSHEVEWARTALLAAEATLLGKAALPRQQVVEDEDEDDAEEKNRDAVASVARNLENRERELRQREEGFKIMEQSTRAAVEEYRHEMEIQITDLKAQLEDAREQHVRDMDALAAERDRLRGELDAAAVAAPRAPAWAARDAELEEAQEKLTEDRKTMQRKALEFLEREETLRDRETKVEDESRKLLQSREEIDQKVAELEAAKSAEPPFDQEAAKREIDMRVMVLQQKASDLMAREELLKKRAEEIQAYLSAE